MNNQPGNIDQMTQLQNIAYVKQFLQRGSIKAMMVVAFIEAIFSAILSFKIADVIKKFLNSGIKMFGDTSPKMLEQLNKFSSMTTVAGLIASGIAFVFPVLLLMIVIKASSDDPTVVPKGAISVLRVFAIIFLVLTIIGSVIMLIFTVLAVKSGGGSVTDIISALISPLLNCLYYYCQVKFLSSVRTACDGVTLSSEGAQGIGVFNVFFAIGQGIALIGVIILLVLFTSFEGSDMLGESDFVSVLLGVGKNFFILVMIYIILGMIYSIAYAMTAFGYRDMVVSIIRESYAAAQNKHTSNQRMMRTYGGGTMQGVYNYSNSGTGVQDGGQNREAAPPVQTPVQPQNVTVPQNVQSQQPQISLNKPTEDSVSVNPYANTGNGSFTPDPYVNTGSGSFTPDPYANTGSGSFTPDPYANTGSGSLTPNPYANTGSGSFTPDPYANTGSGSLTPDPYANTGSGSLTPDPYQQGAENSRFDYQPQQGNSQFDYYDPNAGNSQFDYHDPNAGNSPFDYHDPNAGNSQFDYHDPNAGNSQFDYHDPNAGNSPFDYHDPNAGNSPFDYHDPNAGNSPFDYNPNNPYGNGGNY